MLKKMTALVIGGIVTASLLTACGGQTAQTAQTPQPSAPAAAQSGQGAQANPYQQAKEWALARVKDQQAGVTKMEKDLQAGDLEALKKSWLEAQLNYEKGEAIYAAISAELDDVIDVSDQTGWTGLERIIFGKDPLSQKAQLQGIIDQLKKDLVRLEEAVEKADFNKQLIFSGLTGVLKELAGFVQEVYDGTNISGTRIQDAQSVFEGIALFYDAVAPELKAKDGALDNQIRAQIAVVKEVLGKEKPSVEGVDAETGQLFKLFVQGAAKLEVALEQ